MQIPNELRAIAAEAFTENIAWPEFIAEHGHLLRAAEPYSVSRYHRLREMVLSIVTSGSTGGMFSVSDLDDARAEWFDDDAGLPLLQGTMFDLAPGYE